MRKQFPRRLTMDPVLLRLRAELRSNVRSWLAMSLLIGLAGGLVIAAAAGARRTETAVSRFARATKTTDVAMQTGARFGFADLTLAEVKRLPQVASAYQEEGYEAVGRTDEGRKFDTSEVGLAAGPAHGTIAQDLPKLIAGRAANPRRIDEVVPEESAALRLGLKVGSTFTAAFASPDQLSAIDRSNGDMSHLEMKGPTKTFRVVGIIASFDYPTNDFPQVLLTPRFYRRYAAGVGQSPGLVIHLKHGKADLAPFKAAIERLAHGGRVGFFTTSDFLGHLQRGVHLQAAALWLLATLAALAALLILGQAIARQGFVEADDYPTLRALGMTGRQLFSLAVARAGAMALAGGMLAAGLAIALSPLGPIGSTARKAEPHPGLAVDVVIVGLGALATLLLVLAVSAVPAWRAARAMGDASPRVIDGGERPSAVPDKLARAGLPPTAVAGVRMALERGRGRTAVPVGATVFGVLLAIATIVTALSFSASVDRLVHTPRLYGQNWDAQLGDGYGRDNSRQAIPLLERDRDIGAFSAGTFDEATIAGKSTPVIGMDQVRGSVGPSLLQGRLPRAPDELLLGTKTMAKLGAHVGDVVRVGVGKRSAHLRVVGKAVLPDILGGAISLGRGGMLTFAGLKKLTPRAPRNVYLIRFRPAADKKAALGRLRKLGVSLGAKPVDIANFSRIDSLPFIIGGLLGSVAIATLVHTLITSIRRRRRDLAILKTLGFDRGQVSRAVAWQATTIALLAVLVGVPLGIAGGRWAWSLFSHELGIVPAPVIPVAPILLVVPSALLAANLIAAGPAAIAARTRAALALRAE
jgi:ABC-type lipoprotein release transport system permease subunit